MIAPPESHQARIMAMLHGMNQNMGETLGNAEQAQRLQSGQAMLPAQLQQEQAKTGLMQEQTAASASEHSPEMMQAKLQALAAERVGTFGRGVGMAAPQMAPEMMQQFLEQQGLYHPNPDAADLQSASRMFPGIAPEQALARYRVLKTQLIQRHVQH